jgi:acyl-homoserine lactone acylase PvdQ
MRWLSRMAPRSWSLAQAACPAHPRVMKPTPLEPFSLKMILALMTNSLASSAQLLTYSLAVPKHLKSVSISNQFPFHSDSCLNSIPIASPDHISNACPVEMQ